MSLLYKIIPIFQFFSNSLAFVVFLVIFYWIQHTTIIKNYMLTNKLFTIKLIFFDQLYLKKIIIITYI